MEDMGDSTKFYTPVSVNEDNVDGRPEVVITVASSSIELGLASTGNIDESIPLGPLRPRAHTWTKGDRLTDERDSVTLDKAARSVSTL